MVFGDDDASAQSLAAACKRIAGLEEDVARLNRENAELKAGLGASAPEREKMKRCARCDRPMVTHPNGACPPVKSGPQRSSQPCQTCGGVVERADVEMDGVKKRVWFCPACAWRAKDERAGIRGTGE